VYFLIASLSSLPEDTYASLAQGGRCRGGVSYPGYDVRLQLSSNRLDSQEARYLQGYARRGRGQSRDEGRREGGGDA